MTTRQSLLIIGVACVVTGLLVALAGIRGAARVSSEVLQVKLGTALYAQNHTLAMSIDSATGDTVVYHINNHFTERFVITMNAHAEFCRQSGRGGDRDLHLFALAAAPRLSAIGFISAGQDAGGATSVSCHFPRSFIGTEDARPVMSAADTIAARYRLEYAAHAALFGLRRAKYPAHDRALTVVY